MKIEIEKDFPQYFKPSYPEEFELFSHFEVTAGIPTVLFAITTWKENGKPNVCFHSWSCFHGDKTAFFAVMGNLYQHTHTYANIKREKCFCINFLPISYYDTMWALGIVIFVLVYGRMLEIYLLTSLAPIPMATISHREVGQIGQNYLRSLFAVGFQGLLILVCVAIYAVLIQGIATGGDPIGAIWGTVGYTVLLCFMLFKTGTIARSIFSAH